MHKVFVVDSHPVVRNGVSRIIRSEEDLEICGEAGSISEASEMVKQHNPDIIITGCFFEDGSGVRFIEDMLYYRSDFLVIVFSVMKDPFFAERCIKAGARGFVMKTEPETMLVHAIRMTLQGRMYLEETLNNWILSKITGSKPDSHISHLEVLSNREMEVYQLIGKGMSRKDISACMNIGVRTVDTYSESIKKKLQMKDSREVVVRAVKDAFLENI